MFEIIAYIGIIYIGIGFIVSGILGRDVWLLPTCNVDLSMFILEFMAIVFAWFPVLIITLLDKKEKHIN